MNSTPSQGQTQQQHPSPGGSTPQVQTQSGAAEGLNQSVPEDGGDDMSRHRGDSNRTPRQEQQPLGKPPQPGHSLGGSPQDGADTEDADDEGDTRPSDDTGTQPAGRS